jgi:hypothetical protein
MMTPPVAGARRTSLRQRLLLAAGGLAAAFVLAEAGLRLLGIGYPFLYRYDPLVGSGLRPGVAGWWTREGRTFVRISSDGLRDREHTRDKPPGTYRIAVLGDSYAEALQVEREEAFWALLERLLPRCGFAGGRPVEVINFGKSGRGTGEELLVLRHQAGGFSPDLVLLAFTSGNDVRNNSRALEEDRHRPFFSLVDGVPVLDPGFARDPRFRKDEGRVRRILVALLNRCRVAQLLVQGVTLLRQRRGGPAGGPMPAGGEPGLDQGIYRDPAGGPWEEAWALTEALLAAMRREAAEMGAAFVVVTLTNGIQVHPSVDMRREAELTLGVPDLFHPERRVEAAGRREGFPVIPLAPEMQRRAERGGIFFHGFPDTALGVGHWNKGGHRAAGEIIARELCRLEGRGGLIFRRKEGE